MTAMYRELGLKETVKISLATIIVAVAIGTIFNAVLNVIM